MHKAIILAVALAIAGAATPALALDVPVIGENLIANGSFEGGLLGPVPAREVPPGWAAEAYGGNGQLAIVAGGAPGEGAQCVQMAATEDDSTGLHGPIIEIDPTQAYIQFGWIRLDGSYDRSGVNLGRQWFDAEEKALEQEHSRSYNYVVSGANPGHEWAYYEQLLLPDPTPDDGSFRPDQIPTTAAGLRVWALNYRWNGNGYFDGLGLYQVDYAAIARTEIFGALAAADIEEIARDVRETLTKLPEDAPAAARARTLLFELDGLKQRALAEDGRPVLEWMADEERTPGLIDELRETTWELKIEALLQEAG